MSSTEPARQRRCKGWKVCAAIWLLAAGCKSPSEMFSIFAPYRVGTAPEEYRSPPPSDPRFTEPPSYPSHLLKPVYKSKDDQNTAPKRPMVGGGGMAGPGM